MKVLTVYAHPDPESFTHAVLEEFTGGLREAGHGVEVVDLHAIDFDPVFRRRDMATYLHEDMPPDILDGMDLKRRFVANVPGGPPQIEEYLRHARALGRGFAVLPPAPSAPAASTGGA